MFTGLVQDLGTIRASSGGTPRRLEIASALPTRSFALGESVAVNGVCLTVVTVGDGRFSADAGAETLAKTTAGSWALGSRVHLERALAIGDRLGGHMVLGHVDGVGRVTQSMAQEGGWLLEIAAPSAVTPFLLPKGSITVDGVSLTLNTVDAERFSVFSSPRP